MGLAVDLIIGERQDARMFAQLVGEPPRDLPLADAHMS